MSQDGAFQEKRELFINFATFHFAQNETETIHVSELSVQFLSPPLLHAVNNLKKFAQFSRNCGAASVGEWKMKI